MTRGFIWSVETLPGKWEPYPYKTNQLIEDAKLDNLSHVRCLLVSLIVFERIIIHKVEFVNEKSERCRLTFSSMQEECQKRKRKVRRVKIDSALPNVRKVFILIYYRTL